MLLEYLWICCILKILSGGEVCVISEIAQDSTQPSVVTGTS